MMTMETMRCRSSSSKLCTLCSGAAAAQGMVSTQDSAPFEEHPTPSQVILQACRFQSLAGKQLVSAIGMLCMLLICLLLFLCIKLLWCHPHPAAQDAYCGAGRSRPPTKRRLRAPGEDPAGHRAVGRKRSRHSAGHTVAPADRAARRPQPAQPCGWGLPRLGDREDVDMQEKAIVCCPSARAGGRGDEARGPWQAGPRERLERHRDAAEQFGHVIELDGVSEPEGGKGMPH